MRRNGTLHMFARRLHCLSLACRLRPMDLRPHRRHPCVLPRSRTSCCPPPRKASARSILGRLRGPKARCRCVSPFPSRRCPRNRTSRQRRKDTHTHILFEPTTTTNAHLFPSKCTRAYARARCVRCGANRTLFAETRSRGRNPCLAHGSRRLADNRVAVRHLFETRNGQCRRYGPSPLAHTYMRTCTSHSNRDKARVHDVNKHIDLSLLARQHEADMCEASSRRRALRTGEDPLGSPPKNPDAGRVVPSTIWFLSGFVELRNRGDSANDRPCPRRSCSEESASDSKWRSWAGTCPQKAPKLHNKRSCVRFCEEKWCSVRVAPCIRSRARCTH